MYPFKFVPVYMDYIWGGRSLIKFGKDLDEGKTAESWELSCHPDGVSIINNGKYKGNTLISMLDTYSNEIAGDLPESKSTSFPLLIKLIDANDKLSVQVHPDDEFAQIHEGELGKNEMWYILDAKPDAKLIYGLKPGVTREVFENAVKENSLQDCLNYIEVKAGDFINIPAGMVHAIGEGIVLAEIQQNSNTTYRIYDYDRKDSKGNTRPLHLEKALQVINFQGNNSNLLYKGLEYKTSIEASLKMLVANKYFCVEEYRVFSYVEQNTNHTQFHAYVCIEGQGNITYDDGYVSLAKGETVLVPASIGKYRIEGEVVLLKTYVPDLEKDVFARLMSLGYTKQAIMDNVGGLCKY